jgi:hypothetical protein
MAQAPPPGNRELQDLIWGVYKQVQRLRSQWPQAAESEPSLPAALEGGEQRTARRLKLLLEQLAGMQRDLEQLQREAVAQERLRAAAAPSQSGAGQELRITSTTELFEAVRLGIVEIGEARKLLGLGLVRKETGGDGDGSA